jgi:hypothetical protein
MLHDDDLRGDVVWKFRDPNDAETFYFVMKNGDEYVPYFRVERIRCNGIKGSWPAQSDAIKECLLHCGKLASQRMKQAEETLAHVRELQESVQEEWEIVANMAVYDERMGGKPWLK